jgi:uncharacterized membrane protein
MSPFVSAASTTSSRITPVDAARGCAMLLVFASHTKHHFEVSAPELYWFILTVTRIATPAFLLLSGFVVRHVLTTDRTGRAGITLVDRALFLLIVAHALIGTDRLTELGVARWFFDRTMITDAIGIALLFAVLLRNQRAGKLIAQGCTIFVLSWMVASLLTFESPWSQWLAAVMVQWRGSTNPDMDVPIVGYLGVFLMGMALHAHLEQPLMRGDHAYISGKLFRYGIVGVSAALLGVAVWHFGKDLAIGLVGDEAAAARIREFLNPGGKRPPSPAYLAFYGGLSLIVLATFFRGKPVALVQPIVNVTSVIGRASLMCFVLQDWLLLAIPAVAGFDGIQSVVFWLVYLAATTVTIFSVARLWGHVHGNRFLAVGLKALARRRHPATDAHHLPNPRTRPS